MTAKSKFLVIAFLLLSSASLLPAQDIVKKKKYKNGITEEFFVLKEDKSIKHGPALTTRLDVFDNRLVIEYGEYNQNKRSGKWFHFENDPSNSLKSAGMYKDDQRHGYWLFYHPVPPRRESVRSVLGSDKRTSVIESKKGSNSFEIQYDSTDQQVACAGSFIQDKKTGVWNYYSRSGFLLHSYNHDAGQLLKNNLREQNNDFMVYLGGPERFVSYFHLAMQESDHPFSARQTSEVIFEVDKDGTYKFVNTYGDEKYRFRVEEALKAIPNEWIALNKDSAKKLHLISKVVVHENSFFKYESSVDFKVVD